MTVRRFLIAVVFFVTVVFGALYTWQIGYVSPFVGFISAVISVLLATWAVVLFRKARPAEPRAD